MGEVAEQHWTGVQAVADAKRVVVMQTQTELATALKQDRVVHISPHSGCRHCLNLIQMGGHPMTRDQLMTALKGK